ncbi:uncharacterized protein [Taeniopygia guttata]|uniref:uncharacterized protein n=1 Tax=Taeniopygia guttata TaxID=59729 RepID=UPI003BB94129
MAAGPLPPALTCMRRGGAAGPAAARRGGRTRHAGGGPRAAGTEPRGPGGGGGEEEEEEEGEEEEEERPPGRAGRRNGGGRGRRRRAVPGPRRGERGTRGAVPALTNGPGSSGRGRKEPPGRLYPLLFPSFCPSGLQARTRLSPRCGGRRTSPPKDPRRTAEIWVCGYLLGVCHLCFSSSRQWGFIGAQVSVARILVGSRSRKAQLPELMLDPRSSLMAGERERPQRWSGECW